MLPACCPMRPASLEKCSQVVDTQLDEAIKSADLWATAPHSKMILTLQKYAQNRVLTHSTGALVVEFRE